GGDDHLLRLSLDPCEGDAGATPRDRSPSRRVACSWNHRFTGDFISSRVLRRHRSFLSASSLFFSGIRFARAHCGRETLFAPGDFRQLRAVSAWRAGLLFLVAPDYDSFFISRGSVAALAAFLDVSPVLFFFYWIHVR